MSKYQNLHRSTSDCVHFVFATRLEDISSSITEEWVSLGISYAYVDFLKISGDQYPDIANAIAKSLGLQHGPYAEGDTVHQPRRWIPFLDDLTTLSYQQNGLVIIIDNADDLLTANNKEMFELIETFLTQFHHWLEAKKPCHLCFQMVKNSAVAAVFGGPHF